MYDSTLGYLPGLYYDSLSIFSLLVPTHFYFPWLILYVLIEVSFFFNYVCIPVVYSVVRSGIVIFQDVTGLYIGQS